MLRFTGTALLLVAFGIGALTRALSAAGGGCDFTVGAGGGDTHRTIQAAVSDLPATGPCTIIVRAGSYNEQVTVYARNASATSDAQRVVLRGEGPVFVHPPDGYAVLVTGSRFVTIEGLSITGAQREGIVLKDEGGANFDVTLSRNDVYNNGRAGGGGILVAGANSRTWIVNNLVRTNTRNGISVQTGTGEFTTYIVNNTLFGNGWNGLSVERDSEVCVVNNLVVGNGTDRGTTSFT